MFLQKQKKNCQHKRQRSVPRCIIQITREKHKYSNCYHLHNNSQDWESDE